MARRQIWWFPFCLLLTSFLSYPAEATREQVEAAYLYKFLYFVEFPPHSPAGVAHFSICVLGDEKLRETLSRTVEGKSIAGRPVIVHAPSSFSEAKACHVLFQTGRKPTIAAQLAALQEEPILTVSDLPDLEAAGNVITFRLQGDQVRFAINQQNAEQHKIVISSHLLRLSRNAY